MDTTILEDLGLTQAEIEVYVALLELGSANAGHILDKSGAQNSVMHRALNSLIEKGLIHYIMEGRKKIYQATKPETFFEFIETKKKRFEKLLPELKQKEKFALTQEMATIYRGIRGVNEVYRQLREAKGKEYLSFEVINDMIYSIGGDASSLGYEYDSSGIPKKYNGAIILSNKAFLKLKDVRRAYARYRIRYSQQKPIKMPGKLERVAI